MKRAGWGRSLQKLNRSVHEFYAETFTHLPRYKRNVNCTSEPDPNRAECCFGAIFDEQSSNQKLGDHGKMGDNVVRREVATCDPWVSYSVCDVCLTAGDWIRRQCDGRTYEVVTVRPDGQGRSRAKLLDKTPTRAAARPIWKV